MAQVLDPNGPALGREDPHRTEKAGRRESPGYGLVRLSPAGPVCRCNSRPVPRWRVNHAV